jgi:hypothetical protein
MEETGNVVTVGAGPDGEACVNGDAKVTRMQIT